MIRKIIFKILVRLGVPVQRDTHILISLHEFKNIVNTMYYHTEHLKVGDKIGFTSIGEESDGIIFYIGSKYPDLERRREVKVFSDHGFQG